MFQILDDSSELALNQMMKIPCFFSFFIALSLSACVSVELPKNQVNPSKSLKFTPPVSPFREVSIPDVQSSWKSSVTSNIITLQSDCSPSGDISLESMESEAKSAFDRATTKTTQDFLFLERRARRSLVQGEMDGVPLSMEIFVLKKNGCRYSMTFSGRTIETEMKIFDQFINGLEIP